MSPPFSPAPATLWVDGRHTANPTLSVPTETATGARRWDPHGGGGGIAYEEKKEADPHGDSSSAEEEEATALAAAAVRSSTMWDGRPYHLATAAPVLPHPDVQCDMVLESMEECVGCLVLVGEQHLFEEGLTRQAAHQRQVALDHGMSEAEAALIRLQMMVTPAPHGGGGDTAGIRSAASPGPLEALNVCGTHESTVGDLCDGIVLPVDTTLPATTSRPGDGSGGSIQDRSARSLVDVAADNDDDDARPSERRGGDPVPDDGVRECAICSDPVEGNGGGDGGALASAPSRRPTFCHLPCCEARDEGNFKVCTACMLVLTVPTKDGTSRVGRCPSCRTWISILTLHSTFSSMTVRKLETSGQCTSCAQVRQPLIEEDPGICDACYLGSRVPLTYECEECHQRQKIPSPLYRSQPTSSGFGNEMWPCGRCQRSTHWRLPYEHLATIPAGDVPEEWGDAFLELARRRVQAARRGIAQLDLKGRNARGVPTPEEGCLIS